MLQQLRQLAQKYSTLLLTLFFSLLTVAALIRLGDIDISLATLTTVQWQWYALVFVMFYLSVIARGLRWRRILNTLGYPISRLYAIGLLTAGLFGSSILPARAGDVGRVAMLKQDHDIPITHSIASIAAERATDVFAVLTLAVIGGLIALQGRMPIEAIQLMGLTAILFGVGFVGLIVTPALGDWLRHPTWLQQRLPLPNIIWTIYGKGVDFGLNLVDGVRRLGQSPVILMVIIVESFIIWLYDVLILYFSLWAIDIDLNFPATMFASMVADLAIAMPLTPGGLGQFEVVLISLLSLFDITTSEGAFASLLVRFAIFWSWIPMSGLITYAFGFARLMDWKNSLNITAEPSLATEPS